MEEIFETIRPIISGLLGAICVYFIVGFTTESAKTSNGRKILEYGLPVKILITILISFSIFVVYAASQARESQIVIASIIAGCFLLGAIFFGYQVFLVKFSYDSNFVYYKSPFCGSKKVPCSSLLYIGYSTLLQADYIVIDGIGKIWCSKMLNGYTELGEFLEQKTQELFSEDES